MKKKYETPTIFYVYNGKLRRTPREREKSVRSENETTFYWPLFFRGIFKGFGD